MDPLLLIVGLASGLVAAVLSRDKWVQHRWRVAARRLDLRFVPGQLLDGDRIYGQRNRYRIELNNRHRKHTSVVLHADHIPTNIHLSARTWGYLPLDDQLLVGDAQFDRAIRVCGPSDEVFARLTPSTRKTLYHAIGLPQTLGATVVITGGRVSYDVEYHVESPDRLERVVAQLESIADALTIERSVPEQLVINARSTHEPESVRLRSLQALLDHHANAPETGPACQSLLEDSNPRLRLVAAHHRAAYPDARRVLREVLEDSRNAG